VKNLSKLSQHKLQREQKKREHDLRVLNCVSEQEYHSRLAVWDSLQHTRQSLEDVPALVTLAHQEFSKRKVPFKPNDHDFTVLANDEINYIRTFVADQTSQYFWYGAIALMIVGTLALYL